MKKLDNLEIYQKGFEIENIGNTAIHNAISRNKEMGIPTVFSINGTILYKLPEGKIQTKSPFKK